MGSLPPSSDPLRPPSHRLSRREGKRGEVSLGGSPSYFAPSPPLPLADSMIDPRGDTSFTMNGAAEIKCPWASWSVALEMQRREKRRVEARERLCRTEAEK